MRRICIQGTFWLALCASISAQAQQPAKPAAPVVPAASIAAAASGEARAPYAWVDFCRRSPEECKVDTSEPERVQLTQMMWKALVSTNVKVNRDIEPVTDMDHWGVVDRWDLAEDGKGDCEEYVLLKRKRLVEQGVPRRALRVTVVIDEDNAGHAVLMVRTDRGDFILDNKRNAILPWQQTGYVYVKRESQDKVAWSGLGGVSGGTITAAR
jgi:predicted transglutaminase-like cysteine proteinase